MLSGLELNIAGRHTWLGVRLTHFHGLLMPIRPPEFDDDRSSSRSKSRKKSKRKKNSGRTIWLIVLLGLGMAAFLAVAVIVVIRHNSHRDRDLAAGTNGPTGGAKGVAGNANLGAELLTNGSFEDGPEPDLDGPGFTPMEAGSTAIPGWTVTRGSVDYIGPYWQHADGRRSIDLNGNEPGAIAQTFRTQPGRKYRLTFSLAGNFCGGGEPAIKTLIVTAAESRAEFSFDTTGRSYEEMGWSTHTWEFTAVAAQTTLEFTSTTELPVACGPAFDKVSVKEMGN